MRIAISKLFEHIIFCQLWKLDRTYTMIQIQNSSVSCSRISAKMSTENADRNTSCSKCTVRRHNTCKYMSRILLNEQVCSYVKRIAGVRCVVCWCVVLCCVVSGLFLGTFLEHLFEPFDGGIVKSTYCPVRRKSRHDSPSEPPSHL